MEVQVRADLFPRSEKGNSLGNTLLTRVGAVRTTQYRTPSARQGRHPAKVACLVLELFHVHRKRGHAIEVDPASRGVGLLRADTGVPRRLRCRHVADADIESIVERAVDVRSRSGRRP